MAAFFQRLAVGIKMLWTIEQEKCTMKYFARGNRRKVSKPGMTVSMQLNEAYTVQGSSCLRQDSKFTTFCSHKTVSLLGSVVTIIFSCMYH